MYGCQTSDEGTSESVQTHVPVSDWSTLHSARKSLAETPELKPKFSGETIAIAGRSTVREFWSQLNTNASKLLNYFFQALRVPHFHWCVVNEATHSGSFTQGEQHSGHVVNVHERKDRVWREWKANRISTVAFENLRTQRRRGLLNARPDNPRYSQGYKLKCLLVRKGLSNQFNRQL